MCVRRFCLERSFMCFWSFFFSIILIFYYFILFRVFFSRFDGNRVIFSRQMWKLFSSSAPPPLTPPAIPNTHPQQTNIRQIGKNGLCAEAHTSQPDRLSETFSPEPRGLLCSGPETGKKGAVTKIKKYRKKVKSHRVKSRSKQSGRWVFFTTTTVSIHAEGPGRRVEIYYPLHDVLQPFR